MAKIVIEIKNCKECPHFTTANQWSSDGWDRMEDWICQKHNENKAPIRNGKGDIISYERKGKIISSCVEWHEESKIEIPEWCPVQSKE